MNKEKLLKVFKKEDGAGLVLALMVLMVLAVLGVTVAGVTIGSHKLGHINRDSNSAYYIAEAGANLAYEDIKSGVMPAYETSANSDLNYFSKITQLVRAVDGKTYTDFSDQFGGQPLATVTIEPTPSNDVKEYTIVSTGEINGTTRTVKKVFNVNWVERNSGIGLPPLPDDCALYIGGKISFPFSLLSKPMSIVSGDIKTGPEFKGDYYQNYKLKHNKTDGVTTNTIDNSEIPDMEPYRKIQFPDLPVDYMQYNDKHPELDIDTSLSARTISENSRIRNLKVGRLSLIGLSGSPLTVDTGLGNKTINLVVRDLYVYNDINIIGDGTVNLYVTRSMDFVSTSNGLKVGGDRVDQLNIIYSGSESVLIGRIGYFTNQIIDFIGTIFSGNAEMIFYNNVKFEGIIITFGSSLTLYYNVNVIAVIYAPNSEVNMYGGSKLNGGLVANNVYFSRYTLLSASPNEIQYSPLEEYVKQYLFGTGTGETPDLEELIFSQAAIEP